MERDKLIKVAILDYPIYSELMTPIKEYLIKSSYNVQVIKDPKIAPDRDRFIVTPTRAFTGGEAFEYDMLDVSHGAMWGKSGLAVFDEFMLGKMNYCAFSNWEIGMLKRKRIYDKIKSIQVTGRPDMDSLFHLEQNRTGNPVPIVLYAPTWNWEMNGGNRRILETVQYLGSLKSRLGFKLEVAIHPFIQYGIDFQAILSVADRARGINEEFMAYLSRADILIGDMSSNMIQFLATGRPMIAYNSFYWWENTESFDTTNSVFALREGMYQYTGMEFLGECLKTALNEPREITNKRNEVRDAILGRVFDGHCSERIIRYMDKCIREWAGK